MRAVNIYATRTALTEWAGQGYVNKVDGVSLDPRIESFGANTRLAIEVQRFGSYLTTIYAYAMTAIRNADTARDVNLGSIVYGETNGPLAFWSGSAWTVDAFAVATALRSALSGFASSLIIASGVPIPGPPGTTDFNDLTAVPELVALISDPVGEAAALESALETALPTLKATADSAVQPNTLPSVQFTPTGGTATTVQDSLNATSPLFAGEQSIKRFGAPAAGNDWTQVLEYAISEEIPIFLPPGEFLVEEIIAKTGTKIRGTHEDFSTLKLASGANHHVIMTEGADALFGTTPSIVVPYDVYISDLTIDGNRANNSSGCGIAAYGRRLYFKNLKIKNIPDDGFKLEYADQGSGPIGPNQSGSLGMEGGFENIAMDFIGGHGLNLKGPHDSYLYNVHVIHASQKAGNTYDAFHFDTGFNGRCFNLHAYNSGAYPNHRYGLLDTTGGGLEVYSSHFEGSQTANLYAKGPGGQFVGVRCYALRSSGRNVIIGAPQVRFDGVLGGPASGASTPIGITLGLAGDNVAECTINATITGNTGGSLDWGVSSGRNSVFLRGNQASGTRLLGTPNASDSADIQIFDTRYVKPGYVGTPNVAAGGTGATDALLLSRKVNRVTSTTGNNGVMLPDSTPYTGDYVAVINVTASPIKVYPFSGDFIDNATSGYVLVPVGKSASFFSSVKTAWAAVVSA